MARKQKHNHTKKFVTTIILAILAVAIIGLLMTYLPQKPIVGNVLQEIMFYPCVDTDDGPNPYVRGILDSQNTRGEDYCFLGDGQKIDYCIGRACFLREYTCTTRNSLKKGTLGTYMDNNCPQIKSMACYKGACVEPQSVPPEVRQNSLSAAINPVYGSSGKSYPNSANTQFVSDSDEEE